jgi:16S rRNA (guanine527-N7)-methyltransferase
MKPLSSSAAIELTSQRIREALSAFEVSATDQQVAQIREYVLLLLKWNRSVNLTTVAEPTEIVRRHFGESMFGAKLLPVENCRLADFGTGAGFPGLALKIAVPSIDLVLVDSNKKKCAFLGEVVRSLGLSGVQIFAERFEQIRPERLSVDVVTSRAVGEFKDLLRWSVEGLNWRGHVMLWVGADDSTRLARETAWSWQPAVRLPDSEQRFVLIGRPHPLKAIS